jgi:hypothetical protein
VYPGTYHVDDAPGHRDRLIIGLRYLFALPWMFVGGLGFGARRRRLVICFAGALSLAAAGVVSSAAARLGPAVAYAAAHPHPQRRSCRGLLAVHDFPGAVSASEPLDRARHGVYTSLCSYPFAGTTAAGGIDELFTYPSAAAARAAFARNPAELERAAQSETHETTVGTPPYQAKASTTVSSDYFLAGHVPAEESAYDIMTTTLVSTDPLGNVTTYTSSATSGYIRVKNQMFSVILQNSLNPEISTYPSQVRPLIVKVAHEL